MKENLLQASSEPLLNYFNNIIPLNAEEAELVTEFFKSRLYRKKQYVLQENDVCNQFNFVVRGCLRMYKIDEKGFRFFLQRNKFYQSKKELLLNNSFLQIFKESVFTKH